MTKKRRLDNNEFGHDTVKKIVTAFKSACDKYLKHSGKKRDMPPDSRIYNDVNAILDLECKEGIQRMGGLHDLQEANFHSLPNKESSKIIYPDFDCCPVDQKEFTDEMSCVVMYVERTRPFAYAICTIMRDTYHRWFDENCRYCNDVLD